MDEVARARARTRAAILLVLTVFLELPLTQRYFWPQADGFYPLGCPIGDDFVNGWATIRLAAQHRMNVVLHDRQYTPAISELYGRDLTHHMWSYPPTALLLFAPFRDVAYLPGLAVFLACGLAVYLWAARGYLGRGRWVALGMVLLSPTTWMTIVDGQVSFLTGALFVAGSLVLRSRPRSAGILLGLLTFKPQLGLAFPLSLIALKAWRVVAAACLAAFAFALAGFAAFGSEPWKGYVTVLIKNQGYVIQDFSGFFTVLTVSLYGGLRQAGLTYGPAIAVQGIASLLVMAATALTLRPGVGARQRTFMLASAAPLLSPYVLNYDLTLLAVPLALRLFGPSPAARWRVCIWSAAWLVPVLVIWLGHSHWPALQLTCPLVLLASFVAAITEPVHEASARSAAE